MIRKDFKNGVEHIYFNSSINNIYVNSQAPIVAQTQQKTSTILERQRDYEMSISFFQIFGDLPLMFCPIKEGTNTNIDLTNFGVNFHYFDPITAQFYDFPTPVYYVPSGYSFETPKSPAQNNGVQDFSTGYYALYTVQKFLDMVNTAITFSYVAFNGAFPGIHSGHPWFEFSPETGLISLIYPFSYSNAGAASLQMNTLLHNFFIGFNVVFNGFNQPNFGDFDFVCVHDIGNGNAYATPGSNIPPLPANPQYLKEVQEFSYLYGWTNINSILLTSPSIQMRSEFLPTIYNPNSFSQNFGTSSFNTNFGSIISYYNIIREAGKLSVREPIYFNPSYPKWIDLVGDTPLNQVSVSIYVILITGEIIPLLLKVQNSSVDIKFEFRRKIL